MHSNEGPRFSGPDANRRSGPGGSGAGPSARTIRLRRPCKSLCLSIAALSMLASGVLDPGDHRALPPPHANRHRLCPVQRAIWLRLSPFCAISCVCSRSTAFGRAGCALVPPTARSTPPNGLEPCAPAQNAVRDVEHMVRLAVWQVPFQQMQPPVDLAHQPEPRDQPSHHPDPTEAHSADPGPDLKVDPAQPEHRLRPSSLTPSNARLWGAHTASWSDGS